MGKRDKETVRALADRDYWRRVGTLIGSTLYGYNDRRSAGFSDPPAEITGTVGEVLLEQARKIERLQAIVDQVIAVDEAEILPDGDHVNLSTAVWLEELAAEAAGGE